MADNIEQRIKELMADILHLDPAKIDESTSVDNTPKWDSANHISLVLAIEEEFSIAFDVDEIEQMLSFFDITQSVAAKL